MTEQNAPMTVKTRKKKKRKPVINYFFTIIIVFLLIYAAVTIITQQAHISEQEAELQKVKDKITEAQQLNDEYSRVLSTEDERAYMERIAIERMGYGYANEKRFYAMSGN